MYITATTLDDLMNEVFKRLLVKPFNVKTTRGDTCELVGVMLNLTNPRARLSRTETKGTPFSALGELLWYLSGTNELDFILHYIKRYQNESEDGKTVYGAYGPRLLKFRGNINQVENVIDLLKRKPNTRRAVIQLFDAEDNLKKYKEIPCTCTLQFLIRDDKLHMFTTMRSNDALYGLPHDVFTFTMIQEIFARTLQIEIGGYNHAIGSLHFYKDKEYLVDRYLKEGLQPTKNVEMPPMPESDPWPSIAELLSIESDIRFGKQINLTSIKLDSYWLDLVRLLQIHQLFKAKECDKIAIIKKAMSSKIYDTFIEKKLENKSNNGK